MMELRSITQDAPETAALEAVNQEAFPEAERIPLDDLFRSGADGNLDITGIFFDGKPVGFFAVRTYIKTKYLAYFAVRHDLRGQGIGGRALQMLLNRHADYQTVVEYESPDTACTDRSMRLRRKQFYLRNGFRETGWFTAYDGTEFEIACAGRDFDADEFAAFTAYLSTFVSDHLPVPYRKKGEEFP